MQTQTRKANTHSPKPSFPNLNELSSDCLFAGLDTFKLGVGIFDRRLRYEIVNSTLAEIHNIAQSAHHGKTLRQVIGPLADVVGSKLDRVFSTGLSLPNVQMADRLPRRTGMGHWLVYYFPLKDSGGRVIHVGAFVMELKLSPLLQVSPGADLSPTIGEGRRGYRRTVRSDETRDAEVRKVAQKAADLSQREKEVLRFLAVGKSNKEISSILGISIRTVEAYRSRVMLKANATSLVHLVHYAIRHHIVEPQE